MAARTEGQRVDERSTHTRRVSPYLRPEILAAISGLELRARRVVEGFVSGTHRSPYRGYSVEFAEHREYVPGDDIRHIDWRVWGRADRLYVKQYEEETNLRTEILVDCSASMRYPDPSDGQGLTKFEYGATLAACLAFLLTQQQDAVGLHLFNDDVSAAVAPASSAAHLRAMLRALEQSQAERPTDAALLARRLPEALRQRSLVVLISDLLMDVDSLVRGLDRMRYDRHEIIVMHVLAADERTFPFRDRTRFDGLEAPEQTLTVDPQSLRTAYLDALDDWLRRLRTEMLNRQIDFVELSTADPLDVALRRYLAAREHALKR